MLNKNRLIMFALIMMFLIGTTVGLIIISKQIPSNGKIKSMNVDIFWDSECTNKVTSIGWGILEQSEIKNYTLYIKNTGNSPEILSLSTNSWIPVEAEKQIIMSWDYNNEILKPSDVIPVVLTLSVTEFPTIIDFSSIIVISGTG
jgi:archaellum component FlaG (FlaF/FlaG flagellin family)